MTEAIFNYPAESRDTFKGYTLGLFFFKVYKDHFLSNLYLLHGGIQEFQLSFQNQITSKGLE